MQPDDQRLRALLGQGHLVKDHRPPAWRRPALWGLVVAVSVAAGSWARWQMPGVADTFCRNRGKRRAPF